MKTHNSCQKIQKLYHLVGRTQNNNNKKKSNLQPQQSTPAYSDSSSQSQMSSKCFIMLCSMVLTNCTLEYNAENERLLRLIDPCRVGGGGAVEWHTLEQHRQTTGRDTTAARWEAHDEGVLLCYSNNEACWWQELISQLTAPDDDSRKFWLRMCE